MRVFEQGDTVKHRCMLNLGRVDADSEDHPDRVMVIFTGDTFPYPCREVDLVLVRANGPSLRVVQGGR